jgi:spore germination cell wall hydrolase CwlJ-like protein
MWPAFDQCCAALCAWREARGEGIDGMRAVLHVVANRASGRNLSWAQVVYQRLQFSSMTYGQDPQLGNVPASPDAQFDTCLQYAAAIAAGTDPDLTGGATNYFANSIAKPAWAAGMTETAVIGNQTFYK